MKKLVLNEYESYQLVNNGYVTITRNGFKINLGLNYLHDEYYIYLHDEYYIYLHDEYYIKIINPYTKVVIKNSKYRKSTLLYNNKEEKL